MKTTIVIYDQAFADAWVSARRREVLDIGQGVEKIANFDDQTIENEDYLA